ncbi:hypothetical protein PLICRDRAFT_365727, partial [Plicaturopsis crispa FD-325 SS-3]
SSPFFTLSSTGPSFFILLHSLLVSRQCVYYSTHDKGACRAVAALPINPNPTPDNSLPSRTFQPHPFRWTPSARCLAAPIFPGKTTCTCTCSRRMLPWTPHLRFTVVLIIIA